MPDFGSASAAVSVASGVKGLFGGSKTANQAGGANDAAVIAAQTQAEVAAKQESRNDEMWARFKEKYYPLEDEILDPAFRKVADRSEEMAAEAGDAVTSSFAVQRGQTGRALERSGVNPMDGRFRAINRTLDIGEAAARADAMNDARTSERRRVEDTNFARALQVMSLGRNIPAQVSGGAGQTMQAYGSSAGIYSRLAGQLAQDAGSAGSGGIQAITRGLDGLNKSFPRSPSGGGQGTDWMNPDSWGDEINQYRHGGVVRGPSHEQGGEIIEAEGGEYVLSREVVADLGLERIEKMVEQSKERAAARRKGREVVR